MEHEFRIALDNPLVIEWRVIQEGCRWCFYKVGDSPNDAKRSLEVIKHGEGTIDSGDRDGIDEGDGPAHHHHAAHG